MSGERASGAATPRRGAEADPLEGLLVSMSSTLEEVMRCLDSNAKGIALVVSSDRTLLATVTDGDIRRAILRGALKSDTISKCMPQKAGASFPVSAPVGTSRDALLELMAERSVRHVPLVGERGDVLELASLTDFAAPAPGPVPPRAVVMAGGRGSRLHPLTLNTPKPLLPVGNEAIIDRLVSQLRDAGVGQVSVSTHYMAEQIRDHLGSGDRHGVAIDYVHEESPLGTAGALRLLAETDDPILVINGDIVTSADFGSLIDFHRDHQAALTVAVRRFEFKVPYGVVELSDTEITGVVEKPTYGYFANAGIYVVSPDARGLIPRDDRCDMTDLIQMLCRNGKRVVAFPVHEYWRDIGRLDDYEQAQLDARSSGALS